MALWGAGALNKSNLYAAGAGRRDRGQSEQVGGGGDMRGSARWALHTQAQAVALHVVGSRPQEGWCTFGFRRQEGYVG